MKKIFLSLAFGFVVNMVFAQYTYEQIDFFENYLAARSSGNMIHSIDSIVKTGNIIDDNKKDIFVALKKDRDFNVTMGKVKFNQSAVVNGQPDVWDTLYARYTADRLFKTYAYLHNFSARFDTMWAIEYDDNRNVIMKLRSDVPKCGTGYPADADKTNYYYDEENRKTRTRIRLKWTYETKYYPLNKWIDLYNIDYSYENGLLVREYQTYADIYIHNANDTVDLDLKPFHLSLYTYYDSDKLKTYTYKKWDKTTGDWKIYFIDNYTYSGDTTIIIRRNWKDDIQALKNFSLVKILIKNGHEEKFEQRWNDSLNIWQNKYHIYYDTSQAQGYFDKITEFWDTDANKWKCLYCLKYYYEGDTLVKHFEYTGYSSIKELFLYDQNGNLLKYKNLSRMLNNPWELTEDTDYKYDQFNNIVEKDSRYSYSNRYIKIRYYWSHDSINQVNAFVDSRNRWNIGYAVLSDSAAYSKRFTFSDESVTIDNKEYYQLLQSDDETGDDWTGTGDYYREEDGKVWLYDNGEDRLLYDFTLEKGDTFTVSPEVNLIVENIDSIELHNGEKRKAIHLYCSNDPDTVHHSTYGLQTWVEGIGWLQNDVFYKNRGCLLDNNAFLLCYYHDDIMLYNRYDFSACWLSGIKELNGKYLSVFPNPAGSTLFIESGAGIKNIAVYDRLGRQMFIVPDKTLIDVSALKGGLYYMKITFNDGTTRTVKFIKN